MEHYLNFWKRSTDFIGLTGRKGFNIPFWTNVGMLFLLRMLSNELPVKKFVHYSDIQVAGKFILLRNDVITILFFILMMIPTLALISRRLNDLRETKSWLVFIVIYPILTVISFFTGAIIGIGLPPNFIGYMVMFAIIGLPHFVALFILYKLVFQKGLLTKEKG